MGERGVSIDHSSINRWAIRFLLLIEKMARKHKLPVCSGLMYPDTDLGENARHGEVFDEQAKTYVFP